FNPLATVKQASKATDFRSDCDVKCFFQSVAGAHLIRDRTYATDARDDVWHLADLAAAQEGLEETRRLVDVQLDLVDLVAGNRDVQRSFAFHARKGADLECASFAHRYTSD